MRFLLCPNKDGTIDIHVKRTRREEKVVPAELEVPAGKVSATIELMVKKMRDQVTPT